MSSVTDSLAEPLVEVRPRRSGEAASSTRVEAAEDTVDPRTQGLAHVSVVTPVTRQSKGLPGVPLVAGGLVSHRSGRDPSGSTVDAWP